MRIIETQNLSKSFDEKNFAVKNLSFSLSAGEVFGFLGPNGSGKTTTVRLINGILNPTSGKIFIKGEELNQDNSDIIHRISGVLTENAEFYNQLTGLENLLFFANMFLLEDKNLNSKCEDLMKRFDIFDAKDTKLKAYSTGMKKRLKLARAFLNNPEIVFLDEPTSGLDPEGAKLVNNYIKQAAQDYNVTVFLCTHQLKYAEEICTLYGFIDKSNLIAYGKFDELLEKVDSSIHLKIRGENFPSRFKDDKNIFCDSSSVTLKISNDKEADNIIKEIVNTGGTIYEAAQEKMNLEDLYFAIQERHEGQ